MRALLFVIGTSAPPGETTGRFLAYWIVITLALVGLLIGMIVITVLRRSTARLREAERKGAALGGERGPDPWAEAGRGVGVEPSEREE